MNICSFIPARQGSKSIPNKNIKELEGKPLLAWSVGASLKCGLRTIVNTDNESYAQIARGYGAETQLRPARLGGDDTSMLELLKSEIPKTGADIVVLLQPTSPFRKKLHIKLALQYLQQNDEYDSVVVVEKVPEKYNPYQFFIKTESGNKVLFRKLAGWKEKLVSYFTSKKYILGEFPIGQRITRRQDIQAWMPDGSLYVFRSRNLKGNSFYGENVLLIESEGNININSEEEWLEAENYLKSKYNQYNQSILSPEGHKEYIEKVDKTHNKIIESTKQKLNAEIR